MCDWLPKSWNTAVLTGLRHRGRSIRLTTSMVVGAVDDAAASGADVVLCAVEPRAVDATLFKKEV